MAPEPAVSTNARLRMDYETKVFPHTGGYGRYNRVVVVFSWFPNFAVMLNLFSDVFYTLIPDSYHCKPDPELLPSAFLPSNFSRQGYLNLTIPWVNGTGLSHCELFKYPPNTSDFSDKVSRQRVSCTVGWEYAHVAGLHSNFVTEDIEEVGKMVEVERLFHIFFQGELGHWASMFLPETLNASVIYSTSSACDVLCCDKGERKPLNTVLINFRYNNR